MLVKLINGLELHLISCMDLKLFGERCLIRVPNDFVGVRTSLWFLFSAIQQKYLRCPIECSGVLKFIQRIQICVIKALLYPAPCSYNRPHLDSYSIISLSIIALIDSFCWFLLIVIKDSKNKIVIIIH